jgi:hypothetical protein
MVGSIRESPDELIRDLQSVGICTGGVTLQEPLPGLGALGEDPDMRFGRCLDGYDLQWFSPMSNGTITTVFSPIVCANLGEVEISPAAVWGLNWLVISRDPIGDDALEEVSRVTLGSLTDVSTVHDAFCEVYNQVE